MTRHRKQALATLALLLAVGCDGVGTTAPGPRSGSADARAALDAEDRHDVEGTGSAMW